MSDVQVINDRIFNVLLRAAGSCDQIANHIASVDHQSLSLREEHLITLIDDAKDFANGFDDKILSRHHHQNLFKHIPELENIVAIIPKLTLYVNDPGKFDEALDLIELASSLNKKFSEQLSLVTTIHRESKELQTHLITNICNRLEDCKESSLEELKILVNQLIRCNNFSGRELRLKFLQSRDHWFNNECESKAESFDELISFFCQGLPKIFGEYKSIFSETNSLANSKLMAISSSSDDSMYENGAIINSWLMLKTSTFILSLEVHLKSLEQSRVLTPTMIGDTMQKCYTLTNWLASIGFDFSSQLSPLFSRSILDEIKLSIENTTVKFESEFTKIVSKSIESLLLPIEDEILRIGATKSDVQLPKSISHYPIFKIYCLSIIDSMRWLQATKHILSPINLCQNVHGAINASLTRVMNALAVVLNMDNNSNHPILSKIAISFLTEVLPFMMDYCESIFPEKVVLSSLGMSKSEFKNLYASDPEKVRNFRLDLKQIGSPLRSIMPALMQTIEG